MSASNYRKKENKNTKALFSIICLCIISLGLIVYFSTTKEKNNPVNEPTSIVETTEVQHAVTVKETTTKQETKKEKTTKQKETTVPTSMPLSDKNTPYKSHYEYPLGEEIKKGYTQELVMDKTMNDYRAHTAVDFVGKENDKVLAINDGLVTKVYSDSKYGLCVEIDHGGELVARYCGLESASVKKGDFVDISSTIGTLGTVPCEISDGVHLHFVTMIGSNPVNPLDVMGKTE